MLHESRAPFLLATRELPEDETINTVIDTS